ncbi:MAG TPA: phospho-sugar mutase [Candidatus Salinicoccus stercoripullorum]|uniref:Phosphoglucomutase n=1 Tax=Candidatus Salinicoccus stercoripullorum TaxID=2838756 RepID=A0A9D1QFR1_9STAP|nr:phospho-sugar mutase [Candidatus Salinicoccus stercoripullorum]
MDRKQWEDHINGSFIDPKRYEALDTDDKDDAFAATLSFGTAGIRGKIGLGPNRLNRYTVEKVALGLAHSLKDESDPVVVIGYDTRHFSAEFSQTMAAVLAHNGISVKVTKQYTSTPELSFFVRGYGASIGVMITASHNPPEYNGIKVYGPDGAQLIDAPAAALSEKINAVEDVFSIKSKPFKEGLEEGIIQYVSDEMEKSYKKHVTDFIGIIPESELSIVFSSLHGTSVPVVPELLESLGFNNYSLVTEQCVPDGDFPTTASPNPESPEAFEYSKVLGRETGADLLIATDPDADRMGVIVRHEDSYVHLNGNQLGILLLDQRMKEKRGKTPVAIKSIVTSDLGRKITEAAGGEMIEVLTGFKYIGEQIKSLENEEDKQFVLGFEESYGYLLEPFVRDKDAVQVVPYIISMAAGLKNEGRTLVDQLEDIYDAHGRIMEVLYSHTFEGTEGRENIDEIMSQFRRNTPKEIGRREVILTEDFLLGRRIDSAGNSQDIDTPEANVIKLHFKDGWIALRPSGTEPKIKLYVSLDSTQIEQEAKIINDMIFGV